MGERDVRPFVVLMAFLLPCFHHVVTDQTTEPHYKGMHIAYIIPLAITLIYLFSDCMNSYAVPVMLRFSPSQQSTAVGWETDTT